MENVHLETTCPHCSNKLELDFNSWTHELKLRSPDVSPYRDKLIVVEHYKKVKGYSKHETTSKAWDKLHRARAFAAAKSLLIACAQEKNPAETAKRAIDWTEDKARRQALDWNIGTVVKWSADFLQQAGAAAAIAAKPKCTACRAKPAIDGEKFCTECCWCWKCDDEGRPCKKTPGEMALLPDRPPVCVDCKKALDKSAK